MYNVDASAMEYASTGAFVLSTGFSAENADKVISIMRSEINDILQNGVTQAELARTKRNIIAAFELESESTMSVMSIWGKRMLYGIELDNSDIKDKYMRVTVDDVKQAAISAFADHAKEAVAVVGDCGKTENFSIIG